MGSYSAALARSLEATAAAPVAPDARPVERGWDPLLVCLSGFILTSVGRIHQLFPVLQAFKPALVAGAFATLLWVFDRSPGAARTLRMPATRCLLALAGWMALSVPGALWQTGAFSTLIGFIKTALIFVVIVGAVRGVRDVERLTLVYFAGAAVFALVVLMRFQLGSEGRLAKLYYYDANDFATFAVTAMPLGLYFAFTGPRWRRIAAWLGIALLAVGFVWSGSRGGFLAMLAVVAYFLLRYTTVPAVWRFGAVLTIGVLFAATASETYWERISTIVKPKQDYNVTEEGGRWQLWQRGVGYMVRHPVLGVGAGNFPTAEGTISPLAHRQSRGIGVKWGPPHNSYVQIGAELGVVGLVLFGAFLASVFGGVRALRTRARRSAGSAPDPPVVPARLAQSLMASMIGFAVGAFFLTLAYQDMLYTLAGIAVGLSKISIWQARE